MKNTGVTNFQFGVSVVTFLMIGLLIYIQIYLGPNAVLVLLGIMGVLGLIVLFGFIIDRFQERAINHSMNTAQAFKNSSRSPKMLPSNHHVVEDPLPDNSYELPQLTEANF